MLVVLARPREVVIRVLLAASSRNLSLHDEWVAQKVVSAQG